MAASHAQSVTHQLEVRILAALRQLPLDQQVAAVKLLESLAKG